MALQLIESDTPKAEEPSAVHFSDEACPEFTEEGDSAKLKAKIESDAALSPLQLRQELAKERRRVEELNKQIFEMKRRGLGCTVAKLNVEITDLTHHIDAIKETSDNLHDHWRQQLKKFNVDEYTSLINGVTELRAEMDGKLKQAKQELDDFELKQKLCEHIAAETDRMNVLIKQMNEQSKPDAWLKDERMHHLWQVSMMMRFTFRGYFKVPRYKRCGFFLDHNMSPIIHKYGYDVPYLRGNDLLKGHLSAVYSSAMSDDGRYLYTTSQDRTVIIWDLTRHEKICVWTAHESWISCMTYHYGLVVTGSQDNSIRIWNAFTQELVRQLDGHTDLVRCVSFNDVINDDNPESKLVSASRDTTVRIWAVKTGKCLRVLRGHTGFVRAAYFIGDKIISGAYDKTMKIWYPKAETVLEECVDTVTDGIKSKVTDLDINCDQTVIACVSDRFIMFYEWPEMTIIRKIDEGAARGWFHPTDPNLFVAGDLGEYHVKVWNIRNGMVIHEFVGHSDGISKGCFTPDGTLLMSVSSDSTVRVWDVGPDRFADKKKKKM